MADTHTDRTHPALIKRLKRTVTNEKRALIEDHIDHSLHSDDDNDQVIMKLLAKLL